tara:strand:- start:135 stop:341 length:207 start_codon:yes stop_codon:yes gene_type:complete
VLLVSFIRFATAHRASKYPQLRSGHEIATLIAYAEIKTQILPSTATISTKSAVAGNIFSLVRASTIAS